MRGRSSVTEESKVCSDCGYNLPFSHFNTYSKRLANSKESVELTDRCVSCLRVAYETVAPEFGKKKRVCYRVVDGKKICTLCRVNLPIGEYAVYGGQRRGMCRQCEEISKESRRERGRIAREFHAKTEKTCVRCSVTRPVKYFNTVGVVCPDGYTSWCRPCMIEYGKYRAADRHKKAFHKKYGITIEERDQQIIAQGNRCLLCDKEFGKIQGRNKPCVDHCHTTGKTRGILCSHCNTGLGQFFDDPFIMEKAAKYIRDRAGDNDNTPWGLDDGLSC